MPEPPQLAPAFLFSPQPSNPDFRFTCKVPQELCLTHLHSKGMVLEPNPNFLSLDRFNTFLETVEPLRDQIKAFIFEFEYLNKDKMPSLKAFIDKIGEFMTKAPAGLPYAIEPRNLHYIRKEYFKFIQSANLIHVLSEKLYMPHITQVYDEFKSYFGDTVVIRLLGGNRKEIEAKTGNKWDKIVDPKRELASIVQMVGEMVKTRTVVVSVNNHYEGSAPLTIENIKMNLSSYSQGTK